MEAAAEELDRLHSWAGLMSLLDEHWPETIFPTMVDDPARDPGPRIVSLLRQIDRYRDLEKGLRKCIKSESAADELDRLRDGIRRLHRKIKFTDGGTACTSCPTHGYPCPTRKLVDPDG